VTRRRQEHELAPPPRFSIGQHVYHNDWLGAFAVVGVKVPGEGNRETFYQLRDRQGHTMRHWERESELRTSPSY